MSEDYIVSARKYRPATFSSVVGQPALTTTLRNAIANGRLAQAYLFCGPRGVGKTSSARIFAKTINCLHRDAEGDACGECESCRAIQAGNSFNLIELDAASNNGVDAMRNLCEQVAMPPSTGKYKVFIIDEVHMLSSGAFNAFLKTLEEPPRHVIFIMATTEKHKVLPTILSRCQVYDFKRITIADMVAHLRQIAQKEGITADDRSLNVIARKADGAMRDALSIFDQVAASSGGNITYETTLANLNILDEDYYFRLTDAFAAEDVTSALVLYGEIREKGFDSQFFVNGLAMHLRNMMMMYDPRTRALLEVTEDEARRYEQSYVKLPKEWYMRAAAILSETDLNYRQASSKQLLVELALMRLCVPFEKGAAARAALPSLSAKAVAPTKANVAPAPSSPVASAAPVAAEPQATLKSAPAPAPAAQVPPTPVSSPATPGASGFSFRLRNNDRAAEREVRHEAVTTDRLISALTAYSIQDNETATLEPSLQGASYHEEEADRFVITVPHPGAKCAVEGHMARLLPFIKDRLRNDYLQLKVEISMETGSRMTRDDALADIVAHNSVLGDFLAKNDWSMTV